MTQLHLINHINESYKQKVAEISECIRRVLPEKRSLILGQICRLEYRLEEVKAYCESIRQNNLEFTIDTTKQLEKSAEDKVLLLKKLVQNFVNELHSVNDMGHQYETMLQEEEPHIPLLANYRQLEEGLHRAVSKVLDWNINIHPEDLPKTLSELRFEVRKLHTYDELIRLKLHILSQALRKRQADILDFEARSKKELDIEVAKVNRYFGLDAGRSTERFGKSRRTSSSATSAAKSWTIR